MILLAACADPPPDPAGTLLLEAGPVVRVDPSEESQSHVALLPLDGGRWRLAWDEGNGPAQRVETVLLDEEAPAAIATTGGAGFATPELVGAGEDWLVVVRLGDRLEVSRHGAIERGPVRVDDGGVLGFWTAPDLAVLPGGLLVAWWEGELASGPATYRTRSLTDDLVPGEGATVASSEDPGSPMAVEALGDLPLLAWSDAGVWVDAGEPARADDAAAPFPPDRPALAAGADGTFAVGWRAQDAAQVGAGAWLRRFGPGGPLGPSLALGLRSETANRVELAAADGRLAAVWEEGDPGATDVLLQLFDLGTGEPLTGAVRVPDDPAGIHQRARVAFADDGAIGVAWEAGPDEEHLAIELRTYNLVEP